MGIKTTVGDGWEAPTCGSPNFVGSEAGVGGRLADFGDPQDGQMHELQVRQGRTALQFELQVQPFLNVHKYGGNGSSR